MLPNTYIQEKLANAHRQELLHQAEQQRLLTEQRQSGVSHIQHHIGGLVALFKALGMSKLFHAARRHAH